MAKFPFDWGYHLWIYFVDASEPSYARARLARYFFEFLGVSKKTVRPLGRFERTMGCFFSTYIPWNLEGRELICVSSSWILNVYIFMDVLFMDLDGFSFQNQGCRCVIHFRKQSATDGTKLDLNIGETRLWRLDETGQICNPGSQKKTIKMIVEKPIPKRSHEPTIKNCRN